MKARRLMTLDANVFVASLKADEAYSQECVEILRKVPEAFILAEPSIVYQEVCGTLARRVGVEVARIAQKLLDKLIHPALLVECSRAFCLSAYDLCRRFNVYSIDALYLKVALDEGGILVSLDEEFVDRVRERGPPIEVYHASELPY